MSAQATLLLLEALPVAAAVTSARHGRLLHANRRLLSLLRIPDATSWRLDTFFVDPAEHRRLLGRLETEPAVQAEVRGRCPGGGEILVEMTLARIPFGDEPDALLASIVDVTDRRRIEARLAEMARFPEMNPGPVLRLDTAGVVHLANAAARQVFGDVTGRSWLALCPGMGPERWAEILASQGRVEHEAEIGERCYSFVHVVAADLGSVFAYGSDLTARRRDARRLAEQAAQLAELARFPEMNPGPTLRTDLDGNVLIANAAARAAFGPDIVGRCWLDLCRAIDGPAWQRVLASSDPIPFEARVGEREFVFAHRRDTAGRLVFVYGADVTAQKRAERALRQAEKMATLGTLAAGIAHELNNPAAATRRAADQLRDALARLERAHLALAALPEPVPRAVLDGLEAGVRRRATAPAPADPLARADGEGAIEDWLERRGIEEAWALAAPLFEQGLDPPRLDELAAAVPAGALPALLSWAAAAYPVYALLNELAQGSARISEIVRALKDYSYLGQAPVQRIDVHEGLDNTLVILRNKIKRGIEVQRSYGRDVPPIVAWAGELNQVWTNLLDNAADALGSRGRIEIRTRREGDAVVVEVEDDGPGIPESIASRIFDPFFTTKAPGKGTGLGLATTHTVVTERHRGTIEFTSRPGRTVFTVRLPIEGVAAPGPETAREES